MSEVDVTSIVVRLMTPEGHADPYPVYRDLSQLTDAVRFGGNWFLLRHAHVASLLRDPRLQIASPDERQLSAATPWARVSQRFLLFLDPPDHDRIRPLLAAAFTPRAVEALRPRIVNACTHLLDRLDPATGFDLIRDFAHPLPVTVICELLNLPDSDRDNFRQWSKALAPAFENAPDAMLAADQAIAAMTERLETIVAERRAHPGDDLISRLIAVGTDLGVLASDELLANLVLLFFGGHETTVNLIGNGTLGMLQQHQSWEALVARPGLARNAVDELLRYDSPVQLTGRHAHAEIDIGDRTIRRGDHVQLVLGAANRDLAVFDQPDVIQLDRPNAARHVAFGTGIHYCIGAPLARVETEIAFAALARRLPNLELANETPHWRDTHILRGLEDLPVTA